MKNLKKLVALAVLMTVSINVTASDFGTWLGAEAEKKVGKFSFELGAGFRAQNNMKSVERWDASFGISYKPFKFLKFAVGYNYIYQYRIEEKRNHYDEYEQAYEDRPSEIIREYDGYNINKPYWRSKNRFKFDITGDVNIGRFNISLRERYQFTHMNHVYYSRDKYRLNGATGEVYFKETTKELKETRNNNRLRSQLKVEYDIRKCKITPYASIEFFNELDEAFILGKTRVRAGGDIKINKENKISVGYVYQDERDADIGETQHAIEISYKLKF